MEHFAYRWIGWAIAFVVLLPVVHSWWKTYMFLGGIAVGQVRQMLYLARHTRHVYILAIFPATICLIAAVSLIGFSIPAGFIAAMISISIVPILRFALPPSILFLAGSGDRARSLFFRLHDAVSPLRVVTLLDPQRMGIAGQVHRADLMRTSSEKTWKSMVHHLIKIAPVFVVDTVHRTGPVRYEAFLMLSPERVGRTIFLSNEEGTCPSLQAEGIDPFEHAIPVTSTRDMEAAVIQFLDIASTRRKPANDHTREHMHVVREDWNALPTMLMVELSGGLQGELLLAQARQTDKDLIALLLPLASINEDMAKMSFELSWDFSLNSRLVGLYLETSGLVIVRRDFILANSDLLDVNVSCVSPGKLSFDDLNKPDPVGAAVSELCLGWRDVAVKQGLEFRFALK